MFKFFKSRSKVTVKVTCSKFMVPLERDIRNTHVKYECPVRYSKKVMGDVKVYQKQVSQGHVFLIKILHVISTIILMSNKSFEPTCTAMVYDI